MVPPKFNQNELSAHSSELIVSGCQALGDIFTPAVTNIMLMLVRLDIRHHT